MEEAEAVLLSIDGVEEEEDTKPNEKQRELMATIQEEPLEEEKAE